MRFPDLRSVDLNLLLVLDSLLETRSTVLTAQRLHMSQPAVSRALARLRLLFDDKLLIKAARSMVATDRALALSGPLSAVLQSLEQFLGAPSFSPATTDRVFRIATTDYGALALLPNLLRTVAAEAPHATIEVDTLNRDVFGALASGDLDLILIGDLPIPANLHIRHLFTDDYLSAIRPSHPAARHIRKGHMELDIFLKHSHVRVSIFDDRTGTDEALGHVGRSRRISAQLPYFAVASIIAGVTDGILTIPRRAMQQLATHNRLITFTPPIDIAEVSYRMTWHERTHADSGAAWLRDKMVEAAASPVEGIGDAPGASRRPGARAQARRIR